MARAELDGLGPVDGPVLTWTLPRDLSRVQPPGAGVFGFTPGPASSSPGGRGWVSWLGLACLLGLVLLLLSRPKSKGPLR